MVSKKSDYKFVTGLDNIKIDGMIMPKRRGRKKFDMRGEDLAFCAEALGEVKQILKIGSLPTMDYRNKDGTRTGISGVPFDMTNRDLIYDRPRGIAEALKNWERYSPFAFPCKTDALKTFRGNWGAQINVYDAFYSEIEYPTFDKVDPSKFYRGALAKCEDVSALIEATQEIKASIENQIYTPQFTETSYRTTYSEREEGGGDKFLLTDGMICGHRLWQSDGIYSWQSSAADSEITGGIASIVLDDDARGVPYHLQVYAVMQLEETAKERPYHTVYDVTPCEFEMIGNTATVVMRDLLDFAKGMIPFHGVILKPLTSSGDDWQTVYVKIRGFLIQRIRGNHTLY